MNKALEHSSLSYPWSICWSPVDWSDSSVACSTNENLTPLYNMFIWYTNVLHQTTWGNQSKYYFHLHSPTIESGDQINCRNVSLIRQQISEEERLRRQINIIWKKIYNNNKSIPITIILVIGQFWPKFAEMDQNHPREIRLVEDH